MYCQTAPGRCEFVRSAENTTWVEDGLSCGSGMQCRLGRCYDSSMLNDNDAYYSLNDDLLPDLSMLKEIAIGVGLVAALIAAYYLCRRSKLRQQGVEMASHRVSVAPPR